MSRRAEKDRTVATTRPTHPRANLADALVTELFGGGQSVSEC